jgi:hypothetical protein
VRLIDLGRTFCITGGADGEFASDPFDLLNEAKVGSGDTPVSVTPARVKCGRSIP